MKTLNREKTHFWLDTQTRKEFDPNTLVPAHLRGEFLTLIEKRLDYTYDGLKVRKKYVKKPLEIVEEFFSTFTFPEYHESSFGCFLNFELKTFVDNFLKCAKSKNKKIPQATKNHAKQTLMRLKSFLLANTATSS